ESSNVYDSLPDAYTTNGDRQPAIENYQRSLDLDPGNTNAVQKLRELKETEESEQGLDTTPGRASRRFTIPEHDLFPESIAHDPVSDDYFLGSMSRSRILRIHSDGSYEDFLTSPVPELASSIGIKADADRRILWVCTGRFSLFADPGPGPPRTGLLQFDLDSGALLASWLVRQESPYHICNDMHLAADGSAFVTTTLSGRIYRIAPDLGEVALLH
ncbi:MAG: hypothetical protein GY722_28765, partial [bacterium]|nr:hypothetical protein [bacterium]